MEDNEWCGIEFGDGSELRRSTEQLSTLKRETWND